MRYNAAAPLNGNRIHDNTTGIRSTLAGTTDALGFLTGSKPNEISNNGTGVELVSAQAQNQHIFGNLVGVAGSGVLGRRQLGTGESHRDQLRGCRPSERHDPIQPHRQQRRRRGSGGRQSDPEQPHLSQQQHRHRGRTALRDVHIEGNTMYTPAGDLVRIEGGASNTQVLRNILWTEDGYDIFVANDSQTGFFSDFNNLYATGNGKVGFWTRDFFDVLDWQADIARFDLNSYGATVVNPEWARPRFVNLHEDNYELFPMFGTQRFSSPGALPQTGIPHIALRSPDLYIDALRDSPLSIRWESFNNAGGSPVRIDLYQDTPDGPAFLTNIVASTPDDGEFSWTPSASGIGFGTHGLRIQISWVEQPGCARPQPGTVHGARGRHRLLRGRCLECGRRVHAERRSATTATPASSPPHRSRTRPICCASID